MAFVRIVVALTAFLNAASLSSTRPAFTVDSYTKLAPDHQDGPSWPNLNLSNLTAISMHVDLKEKIAQPTQYYFGANVPVYLEASLMASNDTKTKIQSAGVMFLRYPGGSSANKLLWDLDYDTFPYFKTWSWMTATSKYNTDDFIATLQNSAGAVEPLIQLNAALPIIYGMDAAIAYYLKWHEYLLAAGINVTYYEFGNENYGGWEPPYGDYPINGTIYGQAFVAASRALKARYPHIKLGAVALYEDEVSVLLSAHVPEATPPLHNEAGELGRESSGSKDSVDRLSTIISGWMRDLLQTAAATEADFFVIHEYFTSGKDTPSNQALLAEVDLLPGMGAGVASLVAKYAPSGSKVPPMIMSEFNIGMISTGACGATLQFINAVWHAKFIGEAIAGDSFDSIMSFSWADSANACANSGRGTIGDYGMVSRGNEAVADGMASLQFYPYALFRLAFGDSMVNVTSMQGHSSALNFYASTFAAGQVGMVVVNEGAVSRRLQLMGMATEAGVKANVWSLTSGVTDSDDPLAATTIRWNGNVPTPESFPLDKHCVPYTLVTSQLGRLEFDVPAFSVVGIVVYPQVLP